jgi:hypothetical protein
MRSYGGPPGDVVETEKKTGKITGIKSSTEKGRRRLIMREKSVGRKSFSVDLPYKEAKGLERKKMYTANVYEQKRESEYGGMESKYNSGKMKSYLCDEAPELYKGGSKPQFKIFGDDDNKLSGRLKF